jgi:peptide/nickel transport system substrate-binding protein
MTVETLPAALLTPRANDPKGDRFTMAMVGWSDGSGEALVLSYLLHTARDGYGTWNWGRHSDPELDKMIEDAVTDMSPEQRRTKLSKVMEKAMGEVLLIPIHYQSVVVATRKGLGYKTWVTESTIADSVFKTPE